MSQENKFEEYRQKLKDLWSRCCEKSGQLLEKCKENLHKIRQYLRQQGDALGQKLAQLAAAARVQIRKALDFLLTCWNKLAEKMAPYVQKAKIGWEKVKAVLDKGIAFLRHHGKRLLQAAALALLKCREFVKKYTDRFLQWIEPVMTPIVARLPQPKPKPQEPEILEESDEAVSAESVRNVQIPAAPKEPSYPDFLPENVKAFLMKIDPYVRKAGAVLVSIGGVIGLIIKWIWKLRAVIISIPVVWAAIKLAMDNMDRLPEQVGLDIQSTGEFARMVSRSEAVYWPLGITLFCILLTVSSKKPLLPWVISIFTLVLPVLIWITNYYA